MSFFLSRFKGSSCSGWISLGTLELPWCQIKYKGPIFWCLIRFSDEKSHQWSFYKAKTMKIFISGTYLSSKDPGGKFWFQLQIFKFWVWLDSVKALEPLFDLQEAQGKTSNMAPKPTFRRGNLEKSSAPRWSDAPNLGAPKFFWEFSYTYILIIKRVFEVLSNFAFCWTNPPQIPD